MSAHYPKLRAYFLDVTRELIARGIIKAKTGQAIPDVLASELLTVLRYVQEDLVLLVAEMGTSLASLGSNWLTSLIGKAIAPPKRRK